MDDVYFLPTHSEIIWRNKQKCINLENKNTQTPSNKRVSFNKVSEIISKEYSGEKRFNENSKLNSIFELLSTINNKQDQILDILNNKY